MNKLLVLGFVFTLFSISGFSAEQGCKTVTAIDGLKSEQMRKSICYAAKKTLLEDGQNYREEDSLVIQITNKSEYSFQVKIEVYSNGEHVTTEYGVLHSNPDGQYISLRKRSDVTSSPQNNSFELANCSLVTDFYELDRQTICTEVRDALAKKKIWLKSQHSVEVTVSIIELHDDQTFKVMLEKVRVYNRLNDHAVTQMKGDISYTSNFELNGSAQLTAYSDSAQEYDCR